LLIAATPSWKDLRGGAIGFLVWLVAAGVLLFAFGGTLPVSSKLHISITQALANISVLEMIASFFAIIFVAIHQVLFKLLRAIIDRLCY
jgi:hypothetical protein